VLNAGSSSLKFSVFHVDGGENDPTPLVRGQLERLTTEPRFSATDAGGGVVGKREWPAGTRLDHVAAIEFLFQWLDKRGSDGRRIVAAGHRVVHGGVKFDRPVRIDDSVIAELETIVPLAPLHQPHHLAAIRAVARHAPHLPQVACFDTSFHRTQPAVAQTFALPRRFTQSGVRRYGFHGLSYEYIASVLPKFDARAAAAPPARTIVAHLGNGASLCALRGGVSIATTMGFTPVDGLVMGTRCGTLDPSVLLYLMDREKLGVREMEKLIFEQSGLLGVSEISGDMRTLLASNDPRAAEAVDLFVYQIVRQTASLAGALGGLDALVFTGGIGEHATPIRTRVCRDLSWLGVELDEAANNTGSPRISTPASRVAAWVIATNEELMIARHTRGVLAKNDA
jgi:acetate kinase